MKTGRAEGFGGTKNPETGLSEHIKSAGRYLGSLARKLFIKDPEHYDVSPVMDVQFSGRVIPLAPESVRLPATKVAPQLPDELPSRETVKRNAELFTLITQRAKGSGVFRVIESDQGSAESGSLNVPPIQAFSLTERSPGQYSHAVVDWQAPDGESCQTTLVQSPVGVIVMERFGADANPTQPRQAGYDDFRLLEAAIQNSQPVMV